MIVEVPIWLIVLAVSYAALPSVLPKGVGLAVWLRHIPRLAGSGADPVRFDFKAYVSRAVTYDNEIWLRYIDIYMDDLQGSVVCRALEVVALDGWLLMWPLWIVPRLRCIRQLFDRKIPPDFYPTRRQPAGRRNGASS